MGGGARQRPCTGHSPRGLSPRGRGSHRAVLSAEVLTRSIPAWAGEPSSLAVGRPVGPIGLSPRGRESLSADRLLGRTKGSIPAWAGEPAGREHRVDRPWVYPRVGGGASEISQHESDRQGLSPRGRGSPLMGVPRDKREGFIPAWAGEPLVWLGSFCPSSVYPYAPGEYRLVCQPMISEFFII